MVNWKYRDEGKKISKSVIASKTKKELMESKKFLNGLLELRKSEKLTKTYRYGKGNQSTLYFLSNVRKGFLSRADRVRPKRRIGNGK